MSKAWVEFGPPSVEKALGALPVVAAFARRLDVAGIVDRAVPVRDIAYATHGEVIEALIANRLTSPTPLVHVEDWARDWAVEEIFGISPEVLNDERIGRALDAVAPHLEGIVGSVGTRAIASFGVDVARIHWDMTSISLYGAYLSSDPDHIEARFGHPKDRRPDLKQVQAGLAVSADGAVPLWHYAYDGGAGEVAQVVPAMEALSSLAGERSFLLVGDSKLVSYPNLAAMVAARVGFIAPASKSYVGADVLGACDLEAATPVDYVAERERQQGTRGPGDLPGARGHHDPDRQEEDRPRCRVAPGLRVVLGPSRRRRKGPGEEARPCPRRPRASREGARRPLLPDRQAGERPHRGDRQQAPGDHLPAHGGRHRPDDLQAHLGVALRPGSHRRRGRHRRLVRAAHQPPRRIDASGVFRHYKGQEAPERRYHNFKGPLAVAPMFLKNNRRIEALISIICLALLIFALVERAVRLALLPTVKLAGLWAGRPAKPTGRLVFAALSHLRLVPAADAGPAHIPRPTPLQTRLLELLRVDPRQPR
jgi:hypothetical protein